MEELPVNVLSRINQNAQPVVLRWWAELNAADRQAAIAAWDDEARDRFFTANPEDHDPLPVVIGGRFIPAESPLMSPEWQADYFEYLLNHPELVLSNVVQIKRFGICTAHPDALAALKAGCIPVTFSCPFHSPDCPMRQLLDQCPNQSLQLTGLQRRTL